MVKRRYYKPKHIKKFADRMRRRLSEKELMFLRRLTLANVAPFDFQVRIGFYVVDFVFPSKMLIVELDGSSHATRHERDDKRDEWLARAGFTTWRIPNSQAALWPLSRIAEYERPPEGRGYVDAIKWANAQHDRAHAIKQRRQPSPEIREERNGDFYERLIAKTNRMQESERKRVEALRVSRKIKIIKAG